MIKITLYINCLKTILSNSILLVSAFLMMSIGLAHSEILVSQPKPIDISAVNSVNTKLESAKLESTKPFSVSYELLANGQKTNWDMVRKPDSIITFNETTQRGEIWQRDNKGEISHTRIFPREKKLVEYTQGELKTLNKLPNWNQLASIFNPEQVTKLKKTGEKERFGKQALILEGTLNGLPTIIWWIDELQIPAYVKQGEGHLRTQIIMKALYKVTPAQWAWADSSTFENYAKIDASDLGNMESDPFVKTLLKAEANHHH